jgi:ribosome-binding factor A
VGKGRAAPVYSQRQLRVGELIKQNIGEIFIRNEAKILALNTSLITVTEVKMTPDLKSARVYVIPLGGKETKKIVSLPRLAFVEDNSFEYAEKIERLINTNKKNEKEKSRNN